ncbi:calcium/calmodulin-regulated receptor-like kinase 1 [Corylus avellana]|uniref:calcium/calmodulin-regulated receptor-like kinase 1 n=1 Tax=Corylus avellana TaxID=13451 RepID=UPI00286CAA29|nr:calcium/calmodulin-regulated receptor-like kinase 1 [Corylus avellana]
MKGILLGLIFGFTIGWIVGVGAAFVLYSVFFCIKTQIESNSPIPSRGVDSTTAFSDSNVGQETPRTSEWSSLPQWLEGLKRNNVVSACGIPKCSYKDIQKATLDFTTSIGEGAFGPVYKAQMATGETVAVKILATNSRQGKNDFLSEVLLLGRLHHKNLVNLVGYGAERGQHMLLYLYMSNGSLASHLYSENQNPLSWDLRIQIALDVARGLEYLHYGAFPPVVHRDIKSSNILLDTSMRARIADFGLSREEMIKPCSSNVRGTLGYLDPEYVSTRTFTKKTDVYSFGVLLFEIISGRNPQQGLMEHVELAAMDMEGESGWEEIVDSQLDGNFDPQELDGVAAIAFKCVNHVSNLRPSMRDIVQALYQIIKMRRGRKHHKRISSATADEIHIEIAQLGIPDPSFVER